MKSFQALVAERQPVTCTARDAFEALQYCLKHGWTVKGIMPILSSYSKGV